MTFVSYAQNFEDVILNRVFKDVEKGFYVDVGAHDPTQHSVTRAFYDRGWRGVNVEPVLYWYERLREERPEDTNLRVAVDEICGERIFYEVSGTGLSTLREDVAGRHSEDGYVVRECEVPVRTLDSILEEHFLGDVIHFLKIDVEGAEASVLRSIDLTKVRPWVLVVEATEPLSTKSAHDGWHEIISRHEYECVYFDGLNRFYLASERWDIKPAFQKPPNVFDEFISYTEWDAQQRLESTNRELTRSQERLEGLLRELDTLYSSASWQITKPLRSMEAGRRSVLSRLKRLRASSVRKSRSWLLLILRAFLGQLSRVPGLRSGISRILDTCPKIKTRLRSLMTDQRACSSISIGGFTRVPGDESSLTQRGREVYRVLVDAAEKRDR